MRLGWSLVALMMLALFQTRSQADSCVLNFMRREFSENASEKGASLNAQERLVAFQRELFSQVSDKPVSSYRVEGKLGATEPIQKEALRSDMNFIVDTAIQTLKLKPESGLSPADKQLLSSLERFRAQNTDSWFSYRLQQKEKQLAKNPGMTVEQLAESLYADFSARTEAPAASSARGLGAVSRSTRLKQVLRQATGNRTFSLFVLTRIVKTYTGHAFLLIPLGLYYAYRNLPSWQASARWHEDRTEFSADIADLQKPAPSSASTPAQAAQSYASSCAKFKILLDHQRALSNNKKVDAYLKSVLSSEVSAYQQARNDLLAASAPSAAASAKEAEFQAAWVDLWLGEALYGDPGVSGVSREDLLKDQSLAKDPAGFVSRLASSTQTLALSLSGLQSDLDKTYP